jgi:hypothetical protein
MKIRKEKLRIKDSDVKVKMMDDGYCEYDRVGVGVLDGKVFVCDLECVEYSDVMSENDLKSFWFVKFDSVEECCLSGVKFGWCVEWKESWGYGKDDRFRMKSYEKLNDVEGVDYSSNYKEGDENRFDDWVKENEVSE